MRKLFKITSIVIIPLFLILLTIFSANVIKTDWRYAHQSHNIYKPAFPWASYKFKVKLNKFFINLRNNNSVGLKQTHLLISDELQNKLLSKTPESTKKWVEGFILNKNNDLQEIQVRHRGDNPTNWTMEKKHWRIKTKRKEMFNRVRYLEYIPYDLKTYFAGNLAKKMGILSPKFELIELFINDQSSGIYIQTEKLNETFLRRNRLMPVNLYKGEQYNSEAYTGTDSNLFNNPGLWSKIAYFNMANKNDKSDLSNFLSLVREAELDYISFEKLLEKADINVWSRFAAYQVLAQNYHNDYVHNMRLVFDPWSGIVHPVIIDPSVMIDSDSIHKAKIHLDVASHSLLLLLNKSSLFINEKYKKLLYFLNNSKVIDHEIASLNKIKGDIKISLNRDVEKNFSLMYSKSINKIKEIDILSNDFKKIQQIIIKKLSAKPNATWNFDKKNLSIIVNGELPISNIEIIFKSNAPKWIAIDSNGNNIVDKNEHKILSQGQNKIILPVKLYANRINFSNKTLNMHLGDRLTKLNHSKTKFNILSDEIIKPNSISAENPFTGERFKINNKSSSAVLPSKHNIPIYNDDFISDKQISREFTGTININGNIVVDEVAKIYPGTVFMLGEKSSLIFKNKVIANGTDDKPIIFTKKNNTDNPWATIALQGKKTKGSEFSNVIMDGGSGGHVNEIFYSSMFSLHNTKDIKIEKIIIKNNYKYDDMIHIIYCDNVTIDEATLSNSRGDSIDVDISKNIIIKNSTFFKPGNDAIDFMESEALVESSHILNSFDKGISVGESSSVLIHNSIFKNNNIGLASKDGSEAYVIYSNFDNNVTHFENYTKNLQYGGAGGNTHVLRSIIKSKLNKMVSKDNSKILIDDSSINGKKHLVGQNITFKDNVNFDDSIKIIDKNILSIKHPLFFSILSKKNSENRGSSLENINFSN